MCEALPDQRALRATITVGTVTTGAAGTSASVTNAGTTSAARLNFTIPRGATGATGPAGPAGKTPNVGKQRELVDQRHRFRYFCGDIFFPFCRRSWLPVYYSDGCSRSSEEKGNDVEACMYCRHAGNLHGDLRCSPIPVLTSSPLLARR